MLMDDIKVLISKKLSYYLRHSLEKLNIEHDNEGFVLLDTILAIDVFLSKNESMIKNVVETNSKKRFEMKTFDNKIYIRANQGHSSGQLNDEVMLETIKEPIEGCFHGTYKSNLASIKKNGLSRMSRKHIHIAESFESKSGKRDNCNLVIYINMKSAMDDGFKFYRSDNGVILTPGNDDGFLPPQYLVFDK